MSIFIIFRSVKEVTFIFLFWYFSIIIAIVLDVITVFIVAVVFIFTMLFLISWLDLILNWFVNWSKFSRKLNLFTPFGFDTNDEPLFNKDCWYWLSFLFVRLFLFWSGIFFLISASSFFLRIFISLLFRLIFNRQFSFELQRFFFLVCWQFGKMSQEFF